MDAPRYPKHVFWSDEDEGFIAVAPDLPGSSAFGETEAEALSELDQAIGAWIEAARAAGNTVPAPSRPASPSLPSGKVLVRMPRTLHQSLVQEADREDVSLNQFVVYVLSRYSEVNMSIRSASTTFTARDALELTTGTTYLWTGFINNLETNTFITGRGSTLYEPWHEVQFRNLVVYGEALTTMSNTVGKLSIKG
jgi:predicted RNase H-like HicB family nuclease